MSAVRRCSVIEQGAADRSRVEAQVAVSVVADGATAAHTFKFATTSISNSRLTTHHNGPNDFTRWVLSSPSKYRSPPDTGTFLIVLAVYHP